MEILSEEDTNIRINGAYPYNIKYSHGVFLAQWRSLDLARAAPGVGFCGGFRAPGSPVELAGRTGHNKGGPQQKA